MTGEDLKAWRERHGYATQDSLRQELQVTRDTISRWERSKGPLPRQLELALLALAELPKCRNIVAAHRETGARRLAVKT